MTVALWISNSGRVACHEHGGQYLADAIALFPRRRRHETPLDVWSRATKVDQTEWERATGKPMKCEGCVGGWGKTPTNVPTRSEAVDIAASAKRAINATPAQHRDAIAANACPICGVAAGAECAFGISQGRVERFPGKAHLRRVRLLLDAVAV